MTSIGRTLTAIGLLLLATIITGCGQKGPLYLPPAEQQASER